MSKNVKIVLGIVAGILVVCCVSTIIMAMFLPRMAREFAETSLVSDPIQLQTTADNMLDHSFPPAFSELAGMNLLGISSVFATTDDGSSTIALMQFPAELNEDREAMQTQLESAFEQQQGRGDVEWEQVGSQDVTINGEPTSLVIYEGNEESGTAVRQMIGTFTTKDGNIGMMLLFGPTADWENDGLESFLQSLQ